MDAGIISTRYARAIYEYAVEKKVETQVYNDMQVLLNSYSSYPDLKKVMNNPTVTSEEKIKLFIIASGVQIDATIMTQIVQLIVENGRADYMENIALVYEEIYRKAKGIIIARLVTVAPTTDQIKQELAAVITNGSKEKVEFHAKTDTSIIGGFVLEVEDKRLDASVKNQLNQLRLNLTN